MGKSTYKTIVVFKGIQKEEGNYFQMNGRVKNHESIMDLMQTMV